MADKKRVIIVGAGFGGVKVALDLDKFRDSFQTILINETSYHCYHADLYELAAVILKHEKKLDFENVASTVNIPLSKIFKDKKTEIVIGRVETIDPNQRIVKTQNKSFEYDFLIIATGSETNYFNIEGAREYSHPFKNTADALNIHNDLEELSSSKTDLLQVVIVGAGFTGVELAGELRRFLPRSCQIRLIEGSKQVLTGMPTWAQELAFKRLKSLGIELSFSQSVKKVESDKLICQNGEEFKFDYLIWTAGVVGSKPANNLAGFKFTKRNQLEVKKDLSLKQFPQIFVVGDMVEFWDEKRASFVPPTAWVALSQADVVSKNIYLSLNNQNTLKFIPPSPGFVVPIGSHFAISNLFNLQITGFSGWVLKRLIAFKYLVSILPFKEALAIWWRGLTIYT
ncbi:NAD(P)/FAD-dependent oxidoreductase [Candidatus Daviesbacteria bacterium]|nr:NAD(P)/FAD-dependent oxidoreductase [Candidatus Daviesbacteria bacterium]